MTALGQALDDYLTVRRQLGFKLQSDGRLLAQFVAFVEQAGQDTVTTTLAVAWARQPADVKPHRWRQRLGMVRCFARYLATIDPATEIPPTDLLPARQQRVAPYIYSITEIDALMSAAGTLRPPVRAVTVQTVIGLLAASGMRIGEVLALDDTDIDLQDGVITAIGKWGKQREVPLHPSTIAALRNYQKARDRLRPDRPTRALFITRHGQRLTKGAFLKAFRELLIEVGLEGAGERARPRPHDLRHTFAVRTLIGWHHAGADIRRELPRLSTYLGHVHPEDTYWYLQAVPELMKLAARDLDRKLEGGPR
ncbi:MAG: tyrosine-type recombinase/integrase [Solirubrobacteraceae bacterium]